MSIPTHYILSITKDGYCDHLWAMDTEWFKHRHREVGVTQAEAAARMGKAPTFLTRIYNGSQELRLAEAKALASLLRAPLPEVLVRAGLAKTGDTDVEGIKGAELAEPAPDDEIRPSNATPPPFEPGVNSQQVLTVTTNHLSEAGYRSGDHVLVDLDAKPSPGDIVIAKVYDWRSGTAQSVLRVFEPPYLLSAHPESWREKPAMIDNERVFVTGVVTLSWRARERGRAFVAA